MISGFASSDAKRGQLVAANGAVGNSKSNFGTAMKTLLTSAKGDPESIGA